MGPQQVGLAASRYADEKGNKADISPQYIGVAPLGCSWMLQGGSRAYLMTQRRGSDIKVTGPYLLLVELGCPD